MDPEIPEDVRPLCGFYPEADERQQIHHAFAQRFLPGDVERNPRASFGYLGLDESSDEIGIDC